MRAKYDDRVVQVTPRFIQALEELLRAELAMFQEIEPEYDAELWQWGEAEIVDLAFYDGINFRYGGKDDRPEGQTDDVRVISRIE